MIGILCSIILIFLIAIVHNVLKTQKRFQQVYKVAKFRSKGKPNNLELFSHYSTFLLLGIIGFYLILGYLKGLNIVVFIGLILLYLMDYYFLEYLPHSQWCTSKEGILSIRLVQVIAWENITAYERLVRKEKSILRLSYKGKGIVTRKCEIYLNCKDEEEFLKWLKKKIPYL